MFLPLHDDAPMRRLARPLAMWAVLALTVGAFVLQLPFSENAVAFLFGVVPAVLFDHARLPDHLAVLPPYVTLLTSLFVHGNLIHLGGNMLFLWVFGDNVEDAMGHLRFVLFYFVCGAAAAFVHAMVNPTSPRPLIGASGAVSGVVAAYVILHPRVLVFGLFLKWIPLAVRAVWAIGFWIAFQVVEAIVDRSGGVAWFAHLGGIATGAALIGVFSARGVALFGRQPQRGA